MKHTIKYPLLFLLGLGATAYSQVTVSQNVTLALVETYTAPNLPKKDASGLVIRGEDAVSSNRFTVTNRNGQTSTTEEIGTRMVTSRVSNKEILEDLERQGVIPSITGYSIQLIGSPNAEGIVESKFHVVRRGEAPIDISPYLFVPFNDEEDSDEKAETFSYRKVSVDNPARVTITGNASGKKVTELAYASTTSDLEIDGIYNWTETYQLVGAAPNQVGVWVPGRASITSISGSFDEYEEEDDLEVSAIDDTYDEDTYDEGDSVIEGRISLSAGVVTVAPQAQ